MNLIFYVLLLKDPDGGMVFHMPYYSTIRLPLAINVARLIAWSLKTT